MKKGFAALTAFVYVACLTPACAVTVEARARAGVVVTRINADAHGNLPSYDDFLLTCVGRVTDLVNEANLRLGKVGRIATAIGQGKPLREQLERGCIQDKNFPGGWEDGLVHEDACRDFATYIAGAHLAELRGRGTEKGYRDFCSQYYNLVSGPLPSGKPSRGETKREPSTTNKTGQHVSASSQPGVLTGQRLSVARLWARHWKYLMLVGGTVALLLVLMVCFCCMRGLCSKVPLQVRVIRAQGLRNSDGFTSRSDPYCIITLSERPASEQKTSVIKDSLDPVWGEVLTLRGVQIDDSLEFTVKDKAQWGIRKDELLGTAKLSYGQFVFRGFEGELSLSDPQRHGSAGKLWVKVAPPGGQMK